MGFLAVLAAGAAAYVFGAVWYMILSKPWVTAAGLEVDADGRPVNTSKTPFVIAAIAVLIVAGMMRHIFAMAGIDTPLKGLLAGLGVGAFFIAPWLAINYAYADRPRDLFLIDGGYAIAGPGLIGLVLALF